jgi:Amt family ammonium transporter
MTAPMSELGTAACSIFLLLSPLAGAGIALINAGLGRSRNAAHAMMAALCVIAVTACAWFAVGPAWTGYAGIRPGGLFFGGLPVEGSRDFLVAWFGLMGAGLAGLIPLGTCGDRWRLGTLCLSSAVLAAITFPLIVHWTWGGGWLAARGYLDPAGAGVIHATGGVTALAMTWIIGSRRGKYAADGMPMAIPGHNVVLVFTGCLTAVTGWLGLNCAGALLFTSFGVERIPLIAVNTLLSASGSALAAAAITRIRYTKPDASLTANGWIGGLVASSAVCAFVHPAIALLTGLVAGALIAFSVELLDLKLEVDDPGGSISVHAVGGLWGVMALGMFGPGGWLGQVVGAATVIGFVLPLSYGLNLLIGLAMPHRASLDREHQGMDLSELGAGAYPEFMTHSDDFLQR